MTEQPHDKDFAAFLDGKSDLAERYAELGREEPPPQVDARILAEARAAAKIHRAEFGPRGGWLKPVALAATVLLSFSLVMNVVIESPTRFEQVVTESAQTGAGGGANVPAKKLRALTPPPAGPNQPSATIPEERYPALDELWVADGDSIARTEIELDPGVDDLATAVNQAELARSVETMTVSARRIGGDARLLIVSEYVAAAEAKFVSGLAGAPEMKSTLAGKTEKSQPVTADSVVTDARLAFGEKNQPDDGAEEKPDGSPEAQLRDIERLRAEGESRSALVRLEEFVERYPDHPVSIQIRQLDSGS